MFYAELPETDHVGVLLAQREAGVAPETKVHIEYVYGLLPGIMCRRFEYWTSENPKVVEASKLGFNVFHRSEGSATFCRRRPGRNQGRLVPLGSEPAV